MNRFGLNRNLLKYIAAFFMVLDSMYLRGLFPVEIHMITRFVAPLFAYLMVDGFFKTKNRTKYCLRLWVATILMGLGNMVSYWFFAEKMLGITDNIFFTLAVGFSVIDLFQTARDTKSTERLLYWTAGICLFIAGFMFSVTPLPLAFGSITGIEGGIELLPLIIIAYFFYGHKHTQAILYFAWCMLVAIFIYGQPMGLINGTIPWDFTCMDCEWMTFMVIPFMYLYNEEPGHRSRFNKYFFYVFYPLHLWIITLIAYYST